MGFARRRQIYIHLAAGHLAATGFISIISYDFLTVLFIKLRQLIICFFVIFLNHFVAQNIYLQMAALPAKQNQINKQENGASSEWFQVLIGWLRYFIVSLWLGVVAKYAAIHDKIIINYITM